MKLKKLIDGLPISLFKGSKEVEISGLCSHSRKVAPGDLFIAKSGMLDDGVRYIDEAIAAGAAAVLTDLPDPSLPVAVAITSDVRALEGELAKRFYGDPSSELFVIGVTGTNGKTTTAHLIHHLLGGGMIGTIEYVIGDFRMDAELTTPDVVTNQKLLREMVKVGCESVVMEVSSHALDQGRVDGIDFDVAIFTNLSQDHLDYHGSMEAYAETKAKLFASLKSEATAIIPVGEERMIKECQASVVTYGIEAGDISATDLHLASDHSSFKVDGISYTIPLVGRFNVLNALAALAVRRGSFAAFPPVRGRLEQVAPNVFVDFAHTPDALEKVLVALREFTKGRIILVFGAGGDRDQNKRPQMGEVAQQFADVTILTSDNPRSEDPQKICEQISESALIVVDRKEAIQKALEQAESDDVVLIAGKGHESYQVFAHKTIPFDDRKVIEEVLC
ncbi:MAG: UDP-N-acetylmuramoyl-L-alanyl-D-glutamate--2,6-diaminopimelate ligase [Chlamydiales bacterium]|nr:UDP-N-acetylmuramoyl-L-alanyl-D-glutamate--2,6-diaminopimelate ligase [Chlamydiales bacterium]